MKGSKEECIESVCNICECSAKFTRTAVLYKVYNRVGVVPLNRGIVWSLTSSVSVANRLSFLIYIYIFTESGIQRVGELPFLSCTR